MEPGRTSPAARRRRRIYREYTDATFTTLKPRPAEWEHLGFLGPLVRAEVGDTIKIVFRNNAKFAAAVHPHGVFYNKDSEGAQLQRRLDAAATRPTTPCRPAARTPTRGRCPSAPARPTHEGSSAFWMYHSHNDEIRDVASGLIGPMIVTRKGMARPDGSPTDVDRELVAGFIEVDENHSWYVEENITTYTTDPKGTWIDRSPFGDMTVSAPGKPGAPEPPPDPTAIARAFGAWFKETINGYSYGHTPGMTMKVGQRVRWYLDGLDQLRVPLAALARQRRRRRTTCGPTSACCCRWGCSSPTCCPTTRASGCSTATSSSHLRMGMQAFYTVTP